MSILAYAKLTQSREVAQPPSGKKTAQPSTGLELASNAPAKPNAPQPGVGGYADTLAALVPAEVLGLHAFILTFTTTKIPDAANKLGAIKITERETLFWVFIALFILPIPIYIVAHCWQAGSYVEENGANVWKDGKWTKLDGLDYVRMFIPSLAFLFWTMIQKPTAFDPVLDAIKPDFPVAGRTAIAAIGASLLALVVSVLSKRAEEKPVQ